MKSIMRAGIACWFCIGFAATAYSGVATFDDLATPPALDSATGFEFANDGSSDYRGVTWDPRVAVVGKDYRVDTATPGPLYGIPRSGEYFITNQGDGTSNDGILLTTNQVLQGAWFGRNEYYGFGTGATQVTIHAIGGSNVLASVVYDLPEPAVPGQPGIMGFADTSIFATLAGSITGYRIDRMERDEFAGNWVADDFTFANAVPEPSSVFLLGLGLATLGVSARRCQIRR